MGRLKVAVDHRHFERDGRLCFLMADTCWSAFSNPTMDEWKRYLDQRKAQGYNAIQINILPQWDRGIPQGKLVCPFLKEGKTTFDFDDIPASWFDHACSMLAEMKSRDMIPILVLLWSNYTNGTFFDDLWGHTPLDKQNVPAYVTFAAKTFAKFEPIYFVSGDTNFTDRSVDDYYLPALNSLKKADPEALTSLHICGSDFDSVEIVEKSIPERLLYNENLDFYTYQSGHFFEYEERCWKCAQAFRGLKVRKPVVNSEPCYEGWDVGNHAYGRREIRRTTWLSILSGAAAGQTYGAQGIWQWLREDDFFAPYHLAPEVKKLYACERPFTAVQALKFPGAKDRAFARRIIEQYGVTDLEPSDAFCAATPHTRLAASPDGKLLMLYCPRNQQTRVKLPIEGKRFTLYDLNAMREIPAKIIQETNGFTLDYFGINGDVLLVGDERE